MDYPVDIMNAHHVFGRLRMILIILLFPFAFSCADGDPVNDVEEVGFVFGRNGGD
jgi:hypothetical protein